MKKILLYALYFSLGCLAGKEIRDFFVAPVAIHWTTPAETQDCSKDLDTDCLSTISLEGVWTR